ncbi:MAG TPA: hypothetical protein DEO95_12420 [Ruminococcaceae bacterium]|nr:hypothetical protein [Oscillospiraceae bacterium]
MLDASAFSYQHFIDSRTKTNKGFKEGFSGPLKLATDPSSGKKYMDLLKPYGQYWFVTITPYGNAIEPNVPDKNAVMDIFCHLSEIVGINSSCP